MERNFFVRRTHSMENPNNRNLHRQLTSIFLSSFILVSCGGEDGGSDSNDEGNNALPAVDAGVDQVVSEYETINLSGSGLDSDGSISSYLWEQVSGTFVSLTNSSSSNATFEATGFDTDETLQFSLTVTDNDGGTAVDLVNITVTANVPPVVAFESTSFEISENSTISVETLSSDSDGEVISYEWNQTSGPEISIENSDTSEITFISPEVESPTVVEIELEVQDDDGEYTTENISITVNPVFFEITVSESIDNCGNPYSQEISFTFIDSTGNTNEYLREHDGSRQVFQFADEDNSVKTVKVEKNGWDTIIDGLEPSTPIFVTAEAARQDFCDCDTYNITVINEPALSEGSRLVGVNTYSGAGPSWSNVEICDYRKDFVYIVDEENGKFAKVEIGDDSGITIDGLNTMSSSVLNPTLEDELVTALTYTQKSSYHYIEQQNIETLSGLTVGSPLSSDEINYIDNSESDYLRFWAAFSPNYLSITGQAFASLTGTNFVNLESFQSELHTIEAPKVDIGDSFEFELLNYSNLDISLNDESINLSSDSDIDFNYTFVILIDYSQPDQEWVIAYLPITEGTIDLSVLSTSNPSVTSPSIIVIYLTNQPGVATYQDAIANRFRETQSTDTYITKGIRFALWRDNN